MKFKVGDRVYYCGNTYDASIFEMPGIVVEVSYDPFPYDVEFRYLDSGDSTLLLCSELELSSTTSHAVRRLQQWPNTTVDGN